MLSIRSVGAREDDVGLGGPLWSPVGRGEGILYLNNNYEFLNGKINRYHTHLVFLYPANYNANIGSH